MAQATKRDPLVAHVVPALFRRDGGVLGGAERYAYQLAKFMAEKVRTRLVTFGTKDEEFEDGELSVSVFRPATYLRQNMGNPLSFRAMRSIPSADIIHCHQKHILTTSLLAILAKWKRKKIFVTDLGGGGWDISSYVSTDSWFDAELHISEYSKSLARPGTSVPQKVIWGGVDTEVFKPGATGVGTEAVLFVGRILPHKGIDTLIKSLDGRMQLRVVGQVLDEAYLADLKRLSAGKNVEFRHDVTVDGQLVEEYQSAGVIVLPSVYRDMYGRETLVPELLGQTLLEGMACETPAITTKVASLPEIVRDGTDGFVVPPGDWEALRAKLRWLLQNPAARAKMGKQARQRVLEKFTWPEVVRRCLEIYGMV